MNHIERAQKRIDAINARLEIYTPAALSISTAGEKEALAAMTQHRELLEWAVGILIAPPDPTRYSTRDKGRRAGMEIAARRIIDTLAPEVE